ncbi:MAG: gliding motility-associated peptidyl-prolyl isomerase GldI [Tenacibaculum sp.]
MKYKVILFLGVILFLSSCQKQEARRPKKQGTTNFYKEVLAKNKKLNALEKRSLEKLIQQDTLNHYNASKSGFWYTYITKDTLNSITPKAEDLVLLSYTVADVYGNEIYPKEERSYKIDKEDFIPGLQDGIKLMKKGETVTFVIPSYRAFGVVGDGKKITVSQPIKSTVTLIDIKSNK